MKNLFLTFFEISVSTSLIVLALLVFAPLLNRRYASKWKYYIWIALAIRLIIPINLNSPMQQVVINVPKEITAPIITNTGTAVPITLQAGQGPGGVTLLDFLATAWAVVCAGFLFVHFFSFLHYKVKLIKEGTCIENGIILRQLLKLQKDLRIRNRVSIIKYSGADSPMIIGFFRPVLVLPDQEYSQEELFFILKHELVHLKRNDVYFKLLFVIANAVHWYNPLIYIMQREAGVDMELSCDERVIQGTAFAVRKAYTQTLLSTLRRQHNKTNALTTQFYGGSQIMKKRFKNILSKTRKKNGLSILLCAVGLTAVLGMMTGCAIMEPDTLLSKETDDVAEPETVPAQSQELEESEPESTSSPEDTLSEDGQEIKRIAENFAAAYFSGDTDTIQSLLTDPYEWDIEVYAGLDAAGAGTVSDIALKGLTDAGAEETGSIRVISLEFRDSNHADMLIYLTLEFVKQEDGWKIQFYGLEG